MAQGLNPVEVYEQAWAQLQPILAASSGKTSSSTPCTEWNVQSLINHALAVQNFANSTLSKAEFDMSTMGAVDQAIAVGRAQRQHLRRLPTPPWPH